MDLRCVSTVKSYAANLVLKKDRLLSTVPLFIYVTINESKSNKTKTQFHSSFELLEVVEEQVL